VIQKINDKFVSTWIPYPELKKLADSGDEFAQEVADHWKSPVNLMFLTPEGKFISKLDSHKDFDVHPDTSTRPGQCKDPASDINHARVFFKHLADHLGDMPCKAP
jgi:hypothetical protein